ncbi:hypothetical protein [Actinosynnema sp. NPDC020468]
MTAGDLPSRTPTRGSFIDTLLRDELLPAKRSDEAMVLLDDIVDGIAAL